MPRAEQPIRHRRTFRVREANDPVRADKLGGRGKRHLRRRFLLGRNTLAGSLERADAPDFLGRCAQGQHRGDVPRVVGGDELDKATCRGRHTIDYRFNHRRVASDIDFVAFTPKRTGASNHFPRQLPEES